MKAITRRLRLVEAALKPQADEEDFRLGALVLERRRKRLEASDLIFVPPPDTSLRALMYGRRQQERREHLRQPMPGNGGKLL